MAGHRHAGSRGKTISEAEFRRLWASGLSKARIGALLGISGTSVGLRAKARGLPDRKAGPRPLIAASEEFRELWAAGVYSEDIAAHFGVTGATVLAHVRRLGESSRRHDRWRSISMAQFRELQAGREMARLAERERAAVAKHWARAA